MATIKINRRVFYSIILLIIIGLAVFYFLYIYTQDDRGESARVYKNALYNSILCQHKCPLVAQNVSNLTLMVPSRECVIACTDEFKNKSISKESFEDSELLADNLFADLAAALDSCKMESFDNSTLTYNNSEYFACSLEKMESLKANYTYLE